MLYKISRNVPKNTTADNPDWQKLQISKGTIIEWIIFFPKKAKNLCKFKVEYHKSQILPFSGNEWIYGIFEPITPRENIKIDASPYVLDVYAINTDDTWAHEYNLYVNVMPEAAYTLPPTNLSWTERFSNLFGGGG